MSQRVEAERRQKKRVDFKTHIILTTDDSEVHLDGSSKDLSLKGVYVNTDEALAIGSKCRVEIRLTGMTEDLILRMIGRIVRQEPDGLAVVFKTMDLDSYTHLKNIVRYNTSDPDSIF